MHPRVATTADWPSIEQLLTRLSLPLEGARDHLEQFLLLENADGLMAVGGLEIHPPVALLRSIAVAPEHQGKGLGAKIIQQLIQHATAAGLNDLYLLTTTAESYFPRFGFAKTPRETLPEMLLASRELQGACPGSAVAMHLQLVHTPAAELLRQVTRLHYQLQQHTVSCAGTESLTRCHVITELGKRGKLTLKDLVVHLKLDKAWLSRNVDQMVKDGMVIKRSHEIDRRASWIELTPAGEQYLQTLNSSLSAQTSRILSHIPTETHPQILQALTTLHSALQTEFQQSTQKG